MSKSKEIRTSFHSVVCMHTHTETFVQICRVEIAKDLEFRGQGSDPAPPFPEGVIPGKSLDLCELVASTIKRG